jgi:LysR family transcriptional regulator, hypochlorite-specific transcription factor HypT
MQLKWLEDLLALQEAGSIVRAAQRRHVTHPAFGRRLRALEAWAGAPLIVRDAPTLQFTAEGEAMLDAARDAIAALSRVRHAAPEDEARESVHIVTGRTLARTLLATWYARMQPIFGQRKLQVSTMVVQEAIEMLEGGHADFLLVYFHAILATRLDPQRFTYLRLADEALIPVSSVGPDGLPLHALSRRQATPWLSYAGSLAMGRLVGDHLRSHPQPPLLHAVIETDSADAAHEFVLRGFGVAWLPRSMVAADCRQGRMAEVGDKSHEVPLEVRLYRPRNPLGPLAEALWQESAKTSRA